MTVPPAASVVVLVRASGYAALTVSTVTEFPRCDGLSITEVPHPSGHNHSWGRDRGQLRDSRDGILGNAGAGTVVSGRSRTRRRRVLFGQYLVSRASTRQLEVQESAAHRAELKEADLKFLTIASQMEKAALIRPASGGTADDAVLDRLVDDLWLAQAVIDLAARTEPLRGFAHRYAFCLVQAVRGESAAASALRWPQAQFMDAAYDDMWPGQRRAPGASAAPR